MISKSLASLLSRAGQLGRLRVLAVVGSIMALSTPILAVLLGSILNCLIEAGSPTGRERGRAFAAYLPDLSSYLTSDITPLSKVVWLLVVALVIVLLTAILVYVFYRQIQATAVNFEVALIEKLRMHANKLATVRTLSAQQLALTDCLDYHLPRVRSSLSRWWRTNPRHFVQLVACLFVATLVQPLLALLTAVATVLVVLVYRFVDSKQRAALPVVRERAAQERGTLIDLCLKGPLLESVHEEGQVDRSFNEQLAHYRKDAARSLTSSSWKTPVLIAITGILGCLFLFLVSVQILRNDQVLSIAGAFAFALCFTGVFTSATRIQRSLRELRSVETAATELESFLSLPVEEFNSDALSNIERIKNQIELEHVTLQDSRGRKLLENVSVVFKPGLLIGVTASQAVQAQALVELLMGFGRPVSGRMLVDEKLVTDLRPDCLRQCAHWVASDGALVTGSVRDNLVESEDHYKDRDLHDVVKAVCLSEGIQQLPDGLATIVTPGDDRLNGDDAFRIGLARARMSEASVVIIEEPEERFDQKVELQSVEAIRSLVKHSTITVVLATRIETLRQCDLVVMLHDHKVMDVGTHTQLIQQNELYRHLNYLKFNPFRAVTAGEKA